MNSSTVSSHWFESLFSVVSDNSPIKNLIELQFEGWIIIYIYQLASIKLQLNLK